MKEITVHTEKQLKMDFDAFLRSFKQNKDSSFAFLLGAGASITSGVHSAEDCIWDWKKLIYLSNNPTYESFLDIHADYCRKRIQAWIDEQGGYPKEKSEEEYVFYAENTFPFLRDNSIKCIDQYLQYGHPINAHFPVMRGVCFAVSQYECLLWTHGTIDSVKPNRSYFPGGRGIPSPLRIIKYHGNGSIQTIAREILGFTKMNWNSFDFYTKFPATIDTSNTLAQMGNLLSHYDGRTYDYRYFI